MLWPGPLPRSPGCRARGAPCVLNESRVHVRAMTAPPGEFLLRQRHGTQGAPGTGLELRVDFHHFFVESILFAIWWASSWWFCGGGLRMPARVNRVPTEVAGGSSESQRVHSNSHVCFLEPVSNPPPWHASLGRICPCGAYGRGQFCVGDRIVLAVKMYVVTPGSVGSVARPRWSYRH